MGGRGAGGGGKGGGGGGGGGGTQYDVALDSRIKRLKQDIASKAAWYKKERPGATKDGLRSKLSRDRAQLRSLERMKKVK